MYTEPPEDDGHQHEVEYHDRFPACIPQCAEVGIPSPIHRASRPPMVRCPFCRAEPGFACYLTSSRRGRHSQPLTVFGPFHPSRLELIA